MIRFGFVVAALVLVSSVASTASAQYVPPGGPTLPIELDYFRPQQGVLDNYNQFVAPRRQLANQLREMDQRQTTSFRALDRRLGDANQQLRQSQAAATGTAAGFMNYSHYYSGRAGGSSRGPRAR